MKPVSGKVMCSLLLKKGWLLVRTSGSHYIFAKEGAQLRIVVPVHANQDLKIGLQKAIMKSANITEQELV